MCVLSNVENAKKTTGDSLRKESEKVQKNKLRTYSEGRYGNVKETEKK